MDQILSAFFPKEKGCQYGGQFSEKINKVAPELHNQQFIEQIVKSSYLDGINYKLVLNAKEGQSLEFVESQYVNLMTDLYSKSGEKLSSIENELKALEKLDHLVYEVQVASDRLQNVVTQSLYRMDQYQCHKQQKLQETEIINHQNRKLQQQLNNCLGIIHQKKIDNSQNISPNRCQEDQIQEHKMELEFLLRQLNSLQTGFPKVRLKLFKNKTEALILINRIDGEIQKIEINQLNKYTIE